MAANSNFPMILWINLEQSTKRRNRMIKEFDRNQVTKHHRIEAVNGYDIASLVKSYNVDPRVSLLENACLLSHLKAIHYFLYETSEDYVLICEDDLSFEFKKFWPNDLQTLIQDAPKQWEILQLSIILPEVKDIKDNYELTASKEVWLRHQPFYFSALAYVINRNGATKILQSLPFPEAKLFNPEKVALADIIIFDLANTFTFYKPLFTYPDDNDSLLHSWHKDFHQSSKKFTLMLWQKTQ